MMSSKPANGEIRAFRVEMPDEAIAELRRRIAATRWPSRELVDDRSQGVQLATTRELARYWAAVVNGKLNRIFHVSPWPTPLTWP